MRRFDHTRACQSIVSAPSRRSRVSVPALPRVWRSYSQLMRSSKPSPVYGSQRGTAGRSGSGAFANDHHGSGRPRLRYWLPDSVSSVNRKLVPVSLKNMP